MVESMEQLIEQAADLVSTSERIIVFTGAGVSTESGIPDFRGPDGIWSKYDFDPEIIFSIDRFLSDSQARKLLWDLLAGGGLIMTQAQPNPGHYAIVELEKMGKLHGVVTQNTDGLHQKAGVSENMVFQLHGDLSHASCLSCNTRYPMEEIVEWMKEDIDEPECGQCKGMLRPDAVLYGEQLPFEVLTESESRSRSCDLCIVLGSTLRINPAADIPRYAQQGGAKLVIINIGPTEMDRMADIRIEAKTGEVTPKIIARAKEKM